MAMNVSGIYESEVNYESCAFMSIGSIAGGNWRS